MDRFAGILDKLNKVRKGAVDAYGEGREDNRIAFKRAREDQGLNPEDVRINTMLGTNRSMTILNELIGRNNPEHTRVFDEMGMALSSDPYKRTGQLIGHLGADLTQDRSRELWWLLNAPQAVGNVLTEGAIAKANPNLYNKLDPVIGKNGEVLTMSKGNLDELSEKGALDLKSGRLKKGYSINQEGEEKQVLQRKYEPGFVDALQIPAGFAINSGIGLMNPFGGQEGYEAAMPSEEDKTKTSSVLGEVASKYILGRTGNMLPWSEFQKVRPDVSKDEYMRYKAFKYDKELDFNPTDDGNMNLLPGGVLKYTNDGIHGAEAQFLGRSLPLATAILPTATAIAGTAVGVRTGKPIRGGFLGGMAGALGGQLIGNAIEGERRRRNAEENFGN